MSEQETAKKPSGYVAAISKIMAEVGTVGKTGVNKFQNYNYASIADVMAKVQPLMAEHGLVITQSEIESPKIICDGAVLQIVYEFRVSGSDGVWSAGFAQTGMASFATSKSWDDKAANKCHTSARKYFVLGLFQIPTADLVDADKEDTPQRAAPAPKTAPAAAPVPVEPPVNPETGEVSPHLIKATGTLIEWGALFASAINSSRDIGDVNQWCNVNRETLDGIKGGNARLYARIETIIADKARALQVASSDPAGSVVTGLDKEMGLARTGKGVDIIWKNNQEAIGALIGAEATAAQAVYDNHIERVKKKAA